MAGPGFVHASSLERKQHRSQHRRRAAALSWSLLAGVVCACSRSFIAWTWTPSLAPSFSLRRGPQGRTQTTLVQAAQSEPPEIVDAEVTAIVKLEKDIETEIINAEKTSNKDRARDLGRLLVLTRASAAAAAWQASIELQEVVSSSVADTLREFVGKDDYDINDVADKVEERLTDTVKTLDNVYLTEEAAKNAPEGSNPVVLTQVVTPVAGQMREGVKEAVLGFTGKEDYEFGDISKEAAARASKAVANLLGQEEYQFGDITKAAVGKAKDAVTSFTGKEDYKFGDITKTVLRKALDFLEGDDEEDRKKKQ